MTRYHLRNEMDSISEEYCVDRADIGSAQSEPVVSVAAWSSATAAARRSRASMSRCDGSDLRLPVAGPGLDHLRRGQPDLLPAGPLRRAPARRHRDTSCLRHSAPRPG